MSIRISQSEARRYGIELKRSAKQRSSDKSALEDELYGQIVAAGLPKPLRGVKAIPGRKFAYDFGWALSLSPPRWLLVEVQGGTHSHVGFGEKRRFRPSGHNTSQGINRDCEKLNLAQLSGHMCLCVTAEQVKSGMALRWIEQAIEK